VEGKTRATPDARFDVSIVRIAGASVIGRMRN